MAILRGMGLVSATIFMDRCSSPHGVGLVGAAILMGEDWLIWQSLGSG